MKCWLFLFLATVCFGAEFRFKDRLETAQNGDYIVTEASQMVSLLCIRANTPHSLILEEISAPAQNLKKYPSSWSEWVKAKAPGHTSWSMVEIDLESGQVLECYSFTRRAWIHIAEKESLVTTLAKLPLKAVPSDQRRRIGPPPMPGELDTRKIWNPPLVFEGKKIEQAQFEVFETIWPDDGSEMASKDVTLYFDREKKFAFPFWIQVNTSHLTAALRTIDSGSHLPSLYRTIPHRPPEWVGVPKRTETGLRMALKSPKYYRDFELFAIDITDKEKKIVPVMHTLIRGEEEQAVLEIEEKELNQVLLPEHRYTWLLIPNGHTELYTESSKPFVWTP